MTHKIIISIGSNIRRKHHTRVAYSELSERFGTLECSKVYKCKPVGFDGKAFYNWVALAETSLSIGEVVQALKHIEAHNGRVRGEEKYGPRTLDLDLLTYDNVITNEPVVLPREEILYHAFVLKPLRDLIPHDIHPIAKESYQDLWERFDKSSQHIKPIDFAWSASE